MSGLIDLLPTGIFQSLSPTLFSSAAPTPSSAAPTPYSTPSPSLFSSLIPTILTPAPSPWTNEGPHGSAAETIGSHSYKQEADVSGLSPLFNNVEGMHMIGTTTDDDAPQAWVYQINVLKWYALFARRDFKGDSSNRLSRHSHDFAWQVGRGHRRNVHRPDGAHDDEPDRAAPDLLGARRLSDLHDPHPAPRPDLQHHKLLRVA